MQVEQQPLYTIGHGSRKAEVFLELLRHYGILYLVDVRSKPFSRFHPQFSRDALKRTLMQNSITYIFMGDELGGRPADTSCYNDDGRINYETVSTKPFFRQGIERLKTAYHKNIPVAIMCSERDPAHCHRALLISPALIKEDVAVIHIDENGMLKDHAAVIRKMHNDREGDIPGLLFQ